MPLSWLLASGVVAVAGATCVARAWRGRRVPGMRVCAACGFDMRGTPGLRCPECGDMVTDESALVPRRLRRGSLVIGVALLIAAVAIGWTGRRVAETGWRSLVPTRAWLLLAQWTDAAAPWHEVGRWCGPPRLVMQPFTDLRNVLSVEEIVELSAAADAQLDHPDPEVRRVALLALLDAALPPAERLPSDDVIEEAIALIDDRDRDVQAVALQLVLVIAPPDRLVALVREADEASMPSMAPGSPESPGDRGPGGARGPDRSYRILDIVRPAVRRGALPDAELPALCSNARNAYLARSVVAGVIDAIAWRNPDPAIVEACLEVAGDRHLGFWVTEALSNPGYTPEMLRPYAAALLTWLDREAAARRHPPNREVAAIRERLEAAAALP